ncbi:isoleucine--tRNA ligase [Qingshengfaniella alkalisoli]|uniref:Isoleucine--tRNA ligase n=1 Tax=Qingshengfaniella alkalisoli TaxID=2599296 RepID=A0A5B8IVP3_9RHOB|nr:isoleucine--tRNA ligase [Qingshengfaniella alkalisoli]QDY69543.1 isoleucine--tRNA ligase [Qingshengfaniella alkalisoli]
MSSETPDYKDTLNLPKTDFPMRAGLPKREPDWLARWEKLGVYDRLRDGAGDRKPFILHDGPPYANGHLHIGHALNKVLKDMVVRSQQMMGRDARYVPGWDCHGLPIEWKIEEQYRAKGKDKDEVSVLDFRQECRKFAEGWIDIQRDEFKRLGVTGKWDNPYLTMDYHAEAVIADEFMKFVMNGSLYLGSKPVMWSPVEKTALAEAEVEYKDHTSHTIWVKFPVASGDPALDGAKVVIWTTTPWTIPSNRGVAFSSRISYGLFRVTEAREDNWLKVGETVVLADPLAEDVMKVARVEAYERVADAPDFTGAILKHPLAGADGYWGYDVPMLEGDFVTDDAGTGFVHTAPSHGADDYDLFVKNGLVDRMTHNVLEDSSFAEHVPFFAGLKVFDHKGKEGKANKAIIEKLVEAGALAARGKTTHSYPHSWRSKAPVIYRNTPQWFAAIDKPLDDGMDDYGATIRERALTSIDQLVKWTPQTGRNRLYSMIEARPDWVLSRQRAWGVPLTCFVKRLGEGRVEILRDDKVNARIRDAFEAEGADAWFRDDAAARFLGSDYDASDWEKVTDILDVWFDSGSTHAFVLRDREDGSADGIADLYLEGTDQHRGWFHSSLLQASATKGRAPYRGVLTHGFTLDEKGMKMSKSLGNTVAPEQVIKQYGADILRLWVAQSDYTADLRIGPEILKGVADSYRRLRNTLRFMLGSLGDFSEELRVPHAEMPELERAILHKLAELDRLVRKHYDEYDFQAVFQAVFHFATIDLSSYYFDIRKDALYCDGDDSLRRRSALTVLDTLFHSLATWLAPVLVFTMEEVWLERFPGEESSVHLQDMPVLPESWIDHDLWTRTEARRAVRRVVTGALEIERRSKTIGASLEAAPVVHVPAETAALIDADSFADLCITSQITLTTDVAPKGAFTLDEVPGVAVVFARAQGEKCDRCWKILPDVGTHSHAGVCGRCDEVLNEEGL